MRKTIIILIIFFPFVLFSLEQTDDDYLFADNEGITIVGTRQTTQQMAVIEKEEIERHNASDIAILLQESLNINITRYGTYGNMSLFNLRGLDTKRLAILVDGVPVNSFMDGKFDIEQIDLNSIERIEVIYGGSDSKYNVSGAMGGVINIITVKKQNPGLRFGFSVSNTSVIPGEYRDRNGETQDANWEDLFDTQNYSLSVLYGGEIFSVSANVFANRAENHFLFTDRYNFTRRKDNNEVWDTGASANIVWLLEDLTKLIFSTNFYYGDKNFPNSGFSRHFGNQKDFSTRYSLMLDKPRILHDDFSTEVSVTWHLNLRDFIDSADNNSKHDQQSCMVINRWNWFYSDWLTLRSGFDYSFIYLDSSRIGVRNRHDGGVYLTAEYKPIKQFMISPSAKAVFSSEGDAAFTVIPKLGILWNATDSITIRNNYFRSFKFPDFEELYWSSGAASSGTINNSELGNPNLRPEDGWGADIGVEYQHKDIMKLESVFFTHWLKDSIHWYAGAGGVWRPENVGQAVFFGLENKLNYNIPVSIWLLEKIIISASYQYLLSYLLSFGYSFTDNKRIPYSPEHTIGGSLNFIWQTGSLLVNGHYESSRFNDRANITKLNSHFLLNASVNQKVGDNFSVFGTVRNILNTSYESFYDYPMPGISLTLGMRVNLEAGNE
ncbi:MAG: TonB-dependent receptor [Treponema sp.]|nr:TonB-dependent receptor [Treponema sp.]